MTALEQSATTRLHRDTWFVGWEHVDELPPWLIPTGGTTYWHAVRSAAWAPAFRAHGDRLVVRLLCDQQRHIARARDDATTIRVALTSNPGDGPICATCAGRLQARDTRSPLTFRPRDAWQLPARCPGRDDGDRHCFACGARTRYSHSSWTGSSEAPHRPALALADRYQPCEWHGWTRMAPEYDERRRGQFTGRLHCTSHQCPHITAPRPQRRRRARRRR